MKKKKIRESGSDVVLQALVITILVLVLIVVGYPVLYVVACSFSSADAIWIAIIGPLLPARTTPGRLARHSAPCHASRPGSP